ncbi:hypothetical protein SUGI_0017280 [Cryptomeria japonica]|nr:hypothetical protein SUGI_0017280 [Cryptomeria japonica]
MALSPQTNARGGVEEGALAFGMEIGSDTKTGETQHIASSKSNKLKFFPLIFLIYFEVSGGAFGEETAVEAAGPLLALLGFILFPFVWSIPEALLTAELATTYPGNGGYVVWAWNEFGPFWGFIMGWWKWVGRVINNAAIVALCLDYLKIIIPAFRHGPMRIVGISVCTVVLSYFNFSGLTIVGWTAVILGMISLMPFFLMFFFSIPKLKPSRWMVGAKGDTNWSLYFNTLFWNLNFWYNASTFAGEMDHPQRTFPRALFYYGLLSCVGYILPLLAITGALELKRELWTDGYLAEAAGHIAGAWLKYWIEVGSLLSTVGMFEAQLSSASFQLLGMAEVGLLPAFMARRSVYNTPFLGILVSAGGTLLLSFVNFTTIMPFRVPVKIPCLIVIVAAPVALLIFIMTLANLAVYIISISVTVVGVLGYFLLNACKNRNLMVFSVTGQSGVESLAEDRTEEQAEPRLNL